MALRRTLQPNKNAVTSKIEKRLLQLPKKVVRKCRKKFRTIRTCWRLQGTLSVTQRYHRRGSGAKPPAAGDFL